MLLRSGRRLATLEEAGRSIVPRRSRARSDLLAGFPGAILQEEMEHQQSIIIQNVSGETVLDDLPESVVIQEILVRLPAADIFRCRAVHKSWRQATSTDDFLLAHHNQQPSRPVMYHLKHEGRVFDLHLLVFCAAGPGAAIHKLSQQTLIRCPNRCPYKDIVIHGACDGLFLLSFRDSDSYFDVCNPVTRQCAPLQLLPDPEHGPPARRVLICGFYQHLASKEYRVLYSIWTRNEDFFTSTVDFHVLAVGSKESRPIKEPPLEQDSLDELTCPTNLPVLYRGNLHWLLRYYTSDDLSNIIVFDTTVETFRWMCCPSRWYPWMILLELDGALAICSTHDGFVIDIYVMHDYDAEVWALTHQINLLALDASPQLNLHARTLSKIVILNERELLIELPGCILHCDLDGKFLGKMECDEDEGNRMYITPFRFQENIVPLPFFGMLEDEGDDQMQYSIWP